MPNSIKYIASQKRHFHSFTNLFVALLQRQTETPLIPVHVCYATAEKEAITDE